MKHQTTIEHNYNLHSKSSSIVERWKRQCDEIGSFFYFKLFMLLSFIFVFIFSALNNNQWHSIDIFLNVTSGELTVKVDSEAKSAFLKSYTRQNFTSMLDWTKHSSAIYFGGNLLFYNKEKKT